MSISYNPTTLIMRHSSCFYCPIPSTHDEPTLNRLYGLRCCDTHRASARRDSNAYLHRNKSVKLQDALSHPVIGPFLTRLQTDTTIVRSDNSLDGGWTLNTDHPYVDPMLRIVEGLWRIPMKNLAIGKEKGVSLVSFLDKRLQYDPVLISEIQAILEAGLYASDVAACTSEPIDVPETPCVKIVYVGNDPVRVAD